MNFSVMRLHFHNIESSQGRIWTARAGCTVAAVALQVIRCSVYCSVINKFPMTSCKQQIARPKQPRRATIVCTTEASVWVLDRSVAAYGSHVTRYLPVLSLLSNLGNPPEIVDG